MGQKITGEKRAKPNEDHPQLTGKRGKSKSNPTVFRKEPKYPLPGKNRDS